MDATLDDLVRGLARGHFTSAHLVQAYVARVAEVNDVFHAVIELGPDAEAIARALDQERLERGPRSALHGMPCLLKDNIVTLDKTQATCGSAALLGTAPAAEAGIATILRKAGAVLLGRTNLSEFAGFRGGQATGIFWPNMKASCSSTGSAISVGLGLAFASFGTETVSSLVSPSEKSCVVGLKPTRGLLPTDGMIPVSNRQDALGHIARTVKDVAQILDVVVQFDPRPTAHYSKPTYAESCAAVDLQGVRIGVVEHPGQDIDQPKTNAFRETHGMLTAAGATILGGVRLGGLQEYDLLPQRMKTIVLETEFKADMEAYILSLTKNPRRILTLKDLVDTIQSEQLEEYPARDVEMMLRALDTSKSAPDYTTMLRKEEYYANSGGFEGAMDRHDCDVLIAPAGSLALQAFAAVGGNPAMSVPMGFYPEGTKIRRDEMRGGLVSVAPGIPFSLYLYGRRHGKSQLLRVPYVFEQLCGAQKRAKPYFLPETDLEDIVFSNRKARHL
ncbi:amidase signature domain-containing protein [Parachaetomium inaequale]|uniref:Amidase signature domain-containing protein n=1 Tax=Parachaetomium inaequale TaxID=2588326 RepID=A0AAN6SMP7_9PEZI|nr:amidase signature domain-containing protein [Parachaetomium inaequale]